MEEKESPGCNGEQLFCFECMNAQVICDVDGQEITQKREPEMRKRLKSISMDKSIGMDLPGKATYEEVQTLYKQC